MCTQGCIDFGTRAITADLVAGKRIIEIGACNGNGSLRSYVESMKPSEYIGVDIASGPGVDVVCNAFELEERFGPGSFDLVISTEVLEHIRNWREFIRIMKSLCRGNGWILLTTRSRGFRYHGCPLDFWRFEVEDMRDIFSDCTICMLEQDPVAPGVMILAQRPASLVVTLPRQRDLYSIMRKRRVGEVSGMFILYFRAKFFIRWVLIHGIVKLFRKERSDTLENR